jgi:hypothetical protein
MKSSKSISTLLAMLLACAPMTGLANSEHEKLSAGLRTPSPTMMAPIGTIESLEAVEINGVLVKRDAPVWSGDIIQAAPATTSRIAVKGAGEVLLRGGAAVKLSSDVSAQRLTAAVIKGEMSVTLNPEFSAQIQIGERIYVVSKGAKLNAAWRDGEPVLQTSKGSVMAMGSWSVDNMVASNEQQATPRRTLIKPYNLGASTDVRARSTRSVQVRVTDENDKPIPDAPVIFLISGGSVGGGGAASAGGASGGAGAAGASGGSFAGQTSITVTTNAQGIASTNFTASNITGSAARIRATVQGTDATWEGTFRVIPAQSGFWTPHTAVPVFAIIGAAVGIGIYKIVTKKDPVKTADIIQRPGTSVILP